MQVKDLMSKKLYCCTPVDTIQTAAGLMKNNDVGAIAVVNDCSERKLVGIITDRDICVKAVAVGGSTALKVNDLMSKALVTCSPDESIEACEAKMERSQVRRIPVIDARGICLGVVSQADIALRDTAEHTHHTIAAISQHRPQSLMTASAP